MWGWVLLAIALPAFALLWHSQRQQRVQLRNYAMVLLLSDDIRADQRNLFLERIKPANGHAVCDTDRAGKLIEARAAQCATAAWLMATALLSVQ